MATENSSNDSNENVLGMAATIVSAYVSHNALPASQIPELIQTVYKSLADTGTAGADAPKEPLKPPVPIRRSITPDYVICLEDGKKLKMLKRHLRTNYGLSPEEYRAKWGLPSDYPMVAPNYAKQRSEFAKKIGLGRKRTVRSGRKKK
ncbi:MAG: MucR family transcriptional regulator [Alphaproteobacteria bacterium]